MAPILVSPDPRSRIGPDRKGALMKKLDEQVLKIAKEIVAKFIEVGRVSPTTFDDVFKSVYKSVKEAVLAYDIDEDETS
jgi:hypothetical protein